MRILRVHSVTFRVSYASIARPEDPTQYLLGLNRGLRGYPPRSFDGLRRLLFNLEARPTIKRTGLYVLAGAVFFDAGNAWYGGEEIDLKPAAGLGARLGLPRIYDSPIMRADLARGLARGGVWQLSFGIGQFF